MKNAITSDSSEADLRVIAMFGGIFVPLWIEEESEKNCFIADLNFTQDLETSEITFEFAAGKVKSFKDRNIFPRHKTMSR